MIRVGIPRGLMYYDYHILWKSFFEELGVEVVVSSKTNKEILNMGIATAVDEACLPVKVFHGHVEELKDKVDYIFIPKIISVHKREYSCPKILGLPDMIKHSVKDLPEIIDVKVDMVKKNANIFKSILDAGRYFTQNPFKIIKAYNSALNKYKKSKEEYINDNDISIMVIGNSYNIYDEYINMDSINKLKDQDINVLTPEMINIKDINFYSKILPKRMFWTYGRKMIGSAFNAIYNKKVDGIIYISAFGCGLDSVIEDLIRRKANEFKIPFTLLTIDEHSGQAGVDTRLEAFVDMIKWRVENENNISTHG